MVVNLIQRENISSTHLIASLSLTVEFNHMTNQFNAFLYTREGEFCNAWHPSEICCRRWTALAVQWRPPPPLNAKVIQPTQ